MKKAMLAITLLIFGAIAAFSQVTIASYRGTQVEPQGGGDLCNGYLELALEPGLAPYNVSVSHRTNAGYSAQRQIHDPQFIDGFVSLFGTQVENITQAGLTFDGALVYGRFKNIYGDVLTDDHVKALFKLADDVAASLLSDVRIQLDNNPALKARLLESDFFLKFRKLENSIPDLSDLEKSDLLKDLVDNPGEFLDYMEDLVGDKVRAWSSVIKHADLRKNVDFLDNIKDYSDDLLIQLDADLLNSKYTLNELFLESPGDVTEIWKALKDDPSYHWELFDSDGFVAGSRWEKWSQREFFKDVAKKGKDFELDILTKMKTRSGPEYAALLDKVPDLDDRYLLSQVQFCLPGLSPPCTIKGEFFIADQVWIKYDSDGDLVDMVIVDSKLSQGVNLTPGQTAAKNNVGGDLNYKPGETVDKDDLDEFLPTEITQGTSINTSAFYKVYGDGDGTFVGVE